MIAFTRKAWAFIRRDFYIESSYKTKFVMDIVQSLLPLLFFFFLSDLISVQKSAALSRYGGHYFAFAVVGFAFARYFDLTQRMFSESIRNAQMTGCLDAMLSSQTGCVTIVLMSALYGLISGAVQLAILLGIGRVAFGVDFSRMNIPGTLVVFVLSIMIFLAIGVLSATAVVWLKQGDPISWVMGGFASMLGGAYFPIDIMPGWMQKVSLAIPIRYTLDGLRLTILQGYSVFMVAKLLLTLSAIAAILLPVSLALFAAVVRQCRREGTLMQY
jgi:ABC-2 type transport system permease protein